MSTETPAGHELTAVRAVHLLAGDEYDLFELEKPVEGQSFLHGTKTLLLEHSRCDEEPPSSTYAFERRPNSATEPELEADVVSARPADLPVVGLTYEGLGEHRQDKAASGEGTTAESSRSSTYGCCRHRPGFRCRPSADGCNHASQPRGHLMVR